ncbi:MAG: hypothetical protein NT052_01945 [Candidatus Shapirobacteria bacterium]|nr:hypothetical protein [Candidatus Shapirobacteria bacterium]
MAKYSLLSKREEKRDLKRAYLFGSLSIVSIIAIIVWGIPALIKMAVFFGDIHNSSQPVEVIDSLPPQTPILNFLPEATNSAKIEVSGMSEAGASVKIFITGNENKEIITDKDGNFSTNDLKLTLGNNEIYAIATNKNGKQSEASNKITIWYDNEAPKLEISQPTDKTTITNEAGKIDLIGKTDDPDADVSINGHLVILDKNGNFKYPLNLATGDNNIKIVANDNAGNQTENDLTITYSP